jgi:hypothetical protein
MWHTGTGLNFLRPLYALPWIDLKYVLLLHSKDRTVPVPSRYIIGDSMSSLLLFYHEDNILLPNLGTGRW